MKLEDYVVSNMYCWSDSPPHPESARVKIAGLKELVWQSLHMIELQRPFRLY